MKNNIFKIGTLGLMLATALFSCTKDLDLKPTNDVTAEVVYSTPLGFKQSLAKIYGSNALTGNTGPAGAADVFYPGSDEGQNADFYRTFWNAQVLSTDEAITAWGDPGVPDFHNLNTSPANLFLHGVYYKSIYQITLVNEFLRQSTDESLATKGIAGANADTIRQYRSEVRFLRAFQYWVLIDLFGNPPFVTEDNLIGDPSPLQKNRGEVFAYIETELKDIEASLAEPRTNEYGRADKAAAWALLARLYLNAEVYTGTPKYTEAATYAKKVIDAGYSLVSDYRFLFLADNHLNKSEFIWTINYDGAKTQGYGGTTFLIKGGLGGEMSESAFGVNEKWSGHRATKALVAKFPDANGTADKRAQFYTVDQQLEIVTVGRFKDGYAVTKYRNVTRTGGAPSTTSFSDVDVAVFRLPEMYLIYAEAFLRGGTADATLALSYLNKIRERAYGGTGGNIVANDMNLNYIIDERARELYWEGHRRTDLVRFNRFTESTYLWPWKGGVASGTGVPATRKLYPIPSADMNANRNLVQNPGY